MSKILEFHLKDAMKITSYRCVLLCSHLIVNTNPHIRIPSIARYRYFKDIPPRPQSKAERRESAKKGT